MTQIQAEALRKRWVRKHFLSSCLPAFPHTLPGSKWARIRSTCHLCLLSLSVSFSFLSKGGVAGDGTRLALNRQRTASPSGHFAMSAC